MSSFHPISTTHTFVNVALPLAIPRPFTYSVPEELLPMLQFGVRVEVEFGGQKRYTGLIVDIHQSKPDDFQPKPIIAVIDEMPLINPEQLRLWEWIAEYYLCTLGEVMNAALPANLKLASETILTLSSVFDDDMTGLNDKEYLIAEALTIQGEITVDDVRNILDQKSVYPLIRSMLEKRIIFLKEDLKTKYTPKKVACVRFAEPYASRPELLDEAFEAVARASRQVEALMAFVQLAQKQEFVRRQDIYNRVSADSTVLNAMAKKGIFELYDREVSRLGGYEEDTVDAGNLSAPQEKAMTDIRKLLKEKQTVLLHGVTGSGKTRIYVELIREALGRGEQVLYLLPEIALTTQIVMRLQRVFGNRIAVYHSRLGNNERVEMWNMVLNDKVAVLGARSALFLPYANLGLVIIDEEHDPSFKQNDPNPRYHGRDTALMLARIHGAKVLMGTATPSIETYFNVLQKKYGYVTLNERFTGVQLPEIRIVDAKAELGKKQHQTHFTATLIDALKAAIERGEQAILFQNRRGYAPTYRCPTCDWHSECIHCDVSMTYHKFHNALKCHYCGYHTPLPAACPACGNKQLVLQGFGTEKIEDEIQIYLPEARVGRMDLDTVKAKTAHAQLINDFEERRLDILVGTQMVTKGLDFESVGIVGVLSADQLIQFPDFRAAERAFQLMIQVAGRAGRKHKRGEVLIQAYNTTSPVLLEVLNNDYQSFIQRELQERSHFRFPPYVRLIRITLKHKKAPVVNEAADKYNVFLRGKLGDRVNGPAVPPIGRVRGQYLIDFLIRLERDGSRMRAVKDAILAANDYLAGLEGMSGVRVVVDVDPY
ncbi:MAG: primosomal protein N' [Lewinellaceae bacterium]|nr:primosomal protein N' [Lewinellaceae bacterium]